eukprot:TRINITY_DN222_c0_g1_i14.p1 TRINITY_DN222_c0_g1~~TRINITY_DN222_c0_g1_i14.p1  ORF type:complete len:140 (+),score=12.14 TRINITY_DN222_c0_g1_i14:699-1118(+)
MFFISSSLHLLSSYSHANKCSQHHCAIFSQLFCSLLLTNQATRPHFYLLETFPNNLRINFIMDLNKSINQRQKSYLDPSLFPVLLWLRDVQLLIASVFCKCDSSFARFQVSKGPKMAVMRKLTEVLLSKMQGIHFKQNK